MYIGSDAYPAGVLFNLHAKMMTSQLGYGRVLESAHLVEPRADVRAHNKLDTLYLRLHEHDAEVFVFRRIRVGAKKLHVVGLDLSVVISSFSKQQSSHA